MNVSGGINPTRSQCDPPPGVESHSDYDFAVDFDYSSPEAQAVLSHFSEMADSIRSESMSRNAETERRLSETERRLSETERRLCFYERTLGLAVIPLLVRRELIALGRRLSRSQ